MQRVLIQKCSYDILRYSKCPNATQVAKLFAQTVRLIRDATVSFKPPNPVTS